RHPASAARDERHIDAHPHAALRGHLARGAGEPRSAKILYRLDGVGRDELERRLQQELLKERIPDLNRWALGVLTATELERGEERRAGDPVTAGVTPDEVHRAPGSCPAGRAGRARAHREDIAQDAAHAVRRALVRLDRGGMVVAFDLEDAEQSTAEIDRARVLARAEGDRAAFRRERAQELLRMLVGAVLAPHGPEHRPLQ